MASERPSRLVALLAIGCAIGGLVLAASAMPMVASEAPGSAFFYDGGDDSGGSAADGTDFGDDQAVASDDDGTSLEHDPSESAESERAADDSGVDRSDQVGDRADVVGGDSAILEGLSALASLAPGVDDPTGSDGTAGGEFADAPAEIGGSDAGTAAESVEPSSEPVEPSSDPIEPSSESVESPSLPEDELEFDEDALAEYEYVPSDSFEDGVHGSDRNPQPDESNEDIDLEAGTAEGSGDAIDGDRSTADGTASSHEADLSHAEPTGEMEGIDGESSTSTADTEPESGTDDVVGAAEGGTDHSGNGEATRDDDTGSGLSGLVPDVSGTAVTALLTGVFAVALSYVVYTRDAPLETLMTIPDRLASAAIGIVVTVARRLERAVDAIHGLQSIRQFPALVVASILVAIQERFRRVSSTLSPDSGSDDSMAPNSDSLVPEADARGSPRERVREAFEDVIEASTFEPPAVETTTPARIACSAKQAGAPSEPVDRITASFREVEYGGYDPASSLEETTRAHDRLRNAVTEDDGGASEGDEDGR